MRVGFPFWLPLAALAACVGSQASERALRLGNSAPRFEDYPAVDSLAGRQAPLDFRSDPDARRFRTVLSAGAAAGPNFDGHLAIVTWGCGTQCRSHVILDVRTGRVYDDAAIDFDCYQPEFRVSSALVIERPDTVTFGPCSTGPARYLRWDGERMVPVATAPSN